MKSTQASTLARLLPRALGLWWCAMSSNGCAGTGPSDLGNIPVIAPTSPIDLALGQRIQIWLIEGGFLTRAACQVSHSQHVVHLDYDCGVTADSLGTATVRVRNGSGRDVHVTVTDTLSRDLISQELGFYSAIVNDSLAYVSTYSTSNNNTLWRYNLLTGAHSAIHGRFGPETGGALALNAQRTILFHAGFGHGTVAIIDAATGTLIDSIAGLGGAIYAAAYSDPLDVLFVGTIGHLYAIDIAARTITADLPLTEGVNHLALSPSGDRLYAVRFNSNPTYHSDVLEIDPTTLSVVRTIVSGYMHGILVAQNGQELFAAGDIDGIVHCSLDATPTCGRTGFDTCSTLGVVQSPDGATLYGTGGCVAIYSLPALTLTKVVYTGFGSWAPSVHPQLPYFLQVQQGPAWAFKSYY